MNDLLLEILDSNSVRDENGNVHTLHSAIGLDEAEFIARIISENKLKSAVEIGCAMGTSSLVLADSIKKNGGAVHYIIDPFQKSQWNNIGINNLKKAGFENFKLIEDGSEYALPMLAKQGVKLDFGFIDGWHTFDHTLIDFFYINRLLEINGIVIIDDVGMPAVNRVARYIYNYPAYEYIGHVKNNELVARRKLYEGASQILSLPKHLMGDKISKEFFNPKVLKSDKHLNLNCSMIAFRKKSEDLRAWNWYENF